MKYFKNNLHEVFAYESDGSQDAFIEDNLIEITEKEVLKITNPQLSKTQLIGIANSQKGHLLIEASDKMAPYQDAIDLGIATDKELIQLQAWKQYRVDLNRIDTAAAPDIAWPEKPQ